MLLFICLCVYCVADVSLCFLFRLCLLEAASWMSRVPSPLLSKYAKWSDGRPTYVCIYIYIYSIYVYIYIYIYNDTSYDIISYRIILQRNKRGPPSPSLSPWRCRRGPRGSPGAASATPPAGNHCLGK